MRRPRGRSKGVPGGTARAVYPYIRWVAQKFLPNIPGSPRQPLRDRQAVKGAAFPYQTFTLEFGQVIVSPGEHRARLSWRNCRCLLNCSFDYQLWCGLPPYIEMLLHVLDAPAICLSTVRTLDCGEV